MKLKINKSDFLEALQKVQHIVSNRTTLPILSNVRITANGDSLELWTTDLDATLKTTVSAEIEIEGSTTLPARRLAAIIKELPAEEISITVDEKDVASIRCGPSFFKILGLPEEEFPSISHPTGETKFTLDQSLLKSALDQVAFAVSTDESRYILNGVNVTFKENVMSFVGTDGRRLAKVDIRLKSEMEKSLVVPTKAIIEIQRLLCDTGEITIELSSSAISAEVNGSLFSSKLIEGNFPNVAAVIPAEAKQVVTIGREELLNVTKRVSLLASEKANSIKLVFGNFSGVGKLIISANSPDIGESEESIDINYDGPKIETAFNPDFLAAPLRVLDNDEIEVHLIDSMSPTVLKVADSEFLYVLMPMRAN